MHHTFSKTLQASSCGLGVQSLLKMSQQGFARDGSSRCSGLGAVQRDWGPMRLSIKKRSGRSVRVGAENRARRSHTWRRVGPLLACPTAHKKVTVSVVLVCFLRACVRDPAGRSTREGWRHRAMGGVRRSSHWDGLSPELTAASGDKTTARNFPVTQNRIAAQLHHSTRAHTCTS